MIPFRPSANSDILRASHVLLVRVQSAEPDEWVPLSERLQRRTARVTFVVEDAIKGDRGRDASDTVQVLLSQHEIVGSRLFAIPGVWSGQSLEAGARYVTFGRVDARAIDHLFTAGTESTGDRDREVGARAEDELDADEDLDDDEAEEYGESDPDPEPTLEVPRFEVWGRDLPAVDRVTAAALVEPYCDRVEAAEIALPDLARADAAGIPELSVSMLLDRLEDERGAFGTLFGRYMNDRVLEVFFDDLDGFDAVMRRIEDPELAPTFRRMLLSELFMTMVMRHPAPDPFVGRMVRGTLRALELPDLAPLRQQIVGVYLPNLLGLVGACAERSADALGAERDGWREPAEAVLTALPEREVAEPILTWLRS